jgi:hypothetical protein
MKIGGGSSPLVRRQSVAPKGLASGRTIRTREDISTNTIDEEQSDTREPAPRKKSEFKMHLIKQQSDEGPTGEEEEKIRLDARKASMDSLIVDVKPLSTAPKKINSGKNGNLLTVDTNSARMGISRNRL